MSETEVKHLPVNPCCQLWQEEASRLKGELSESKAKLNESNKARKALRKAIRLLEPQNQMLKKESEEEKKRAEVREKELSSLKSEISALKQQVSLGSKGTSKKDDEESKRVDAVKCSSGKMCADKEAEEKQKELATRLGWEAEVSALKSQIVLLQQGMGVQNETKVLTEEQTEIDQLKKLLEKERKRADSEMKKGKEGMQKASEAQKMARTEKSRADEERRLAAIERKEATMQLERLRAEVEVLRSNLVSETFKFEETNKKLETEKQKVIEEKQRADNEMTKDDEKRRLLEMTERHILEEKSRSDCLSQQIEDDRHSLGKLQEEIAKYASFTKNVKPPGDVSVDNTGFRTGNLNILPQLEVINRESGVSKLVMDCVQCRDLSKELKEVKQKARREKKLANSEMAKAEELRKIVETYGRNTMVNSRQAEELAHELQDNRCKTDELKKAINELMSSEILVNPLVSTHANPRIVKLLKKELKICKMQVKHAKEVASLEKDRNLLLQQEIRRIKRECSLISDHFDSLDKCFSSQNGGIDDLRKKCNVSREPGLNLKRKYLEEEPCQMISSTTLNAYDALKHGMESTGPLLESGKDRT